MNSEEARYEICLKGHLDESWRARFEGMDIRIGIDPQGFPLTILSGQITDQAALHGMLAIIRDIGIPVISVNRIGAR